MTDWQERAEKAEARVVELEAKLKLAKQLLWREGDEGPIGGEELKVSQSLGSTVAPASESAVRETYCDRMWRAKTHRFDPEVPEGRISATFILSDQEYHALLSTPLPVGGL